MKKLDWIIIHISDSSFGSEREIRKWHLERGWRDIGYHFIIDNGWISPDFYLPAMNGSIELGRPLDGDAFVEDNEIGAHTLGYNASSLGICVVGKKEWTFSQEASALRLCRQLMKQFTISPSHVLGHCETESGKKEGKTCPNYPMEVFRAKLISEV